MCFEDKEEELVAYMENAKICLKRSLDVNSRLISDSAESVTVSLMCAIMPLNHEFQSVQGFFLPCQFRLMSTSRSACPVPGPSSLNDD